MGCLGFTTNMDDSGIPPDLQTIVKTTEHLGAVDDVFGRRTRPPYSGTPQRKTQEALG